MKYKSLFLALCITTSLFGMEVESEKPSKELTVFSENRLKYTPHFKSIQARQIGRVPQKNELKFKSIQRLWNFTERLVLPHEGVTSVALSPDGDTIATASDKSKIVRLWNHKGEALPNIDHDHKVKLITFSPDGKMLLLTPEKGNETVVRDLEGIEKVRILHEHPVSSATFDSEGKFLMVQFSQLGLEVWNLAGEKFVSLGSKENISAACFSSDREKIIRTLTNIGLEKVITTWNLKGEKIKTHAYTDMLLTLKSVFSPDGSKIVCIPRGGRAHLANLNGRQLALLQHHTEKLGDLSVAFSSDGNIIATREMFDNEVLFFNLKGDKLASMKYDDCHFGLESLTFSADGQHMAVLVDYNAAHIWRTF